MSNSTDLEIVATLNQLLLGEDSKITRVYFDEWALGFVTDNCDARVNTAIECYDGEKKLWSIPAHDHQKRSSSTAMLAALVGSRIISFRIQEGEFLELTLDTSEVLKFRMDYDFENFEIGTIAF